MKRSGSAAARQRPACPGATGRTRRSEAKGGAALRRGLALLLPLALLAACGSDPNKTPPSCPKVSILGDAKRAVEFRPVPGRDPTDVVLEVEIAGIGSGCDFSSRNTVVTVSTNIGITATRGPASQGEAVGSVNYFIAVLDRQQTILQKRVFDASIKLPVGTRRGGVADQTVQTIPLDGRKSGEYEILVGLQLTEEQLRYNRLGAAQR